MHLLKPRAVYLVRCEMEVSVQLSLGVTPASNAQLSCK